MLIGMFLSMLFVKHMLNKELLYMVSCFEIMLFLIWIVIYLLFKNRYWIAVSTVWLFIIIDVVTLYDESERAIFEEVSYKQDQSWLA